MDAWQQQRNHRNNQRDPADHNIPAADERQQRHTTEATSMTLLTTKYQLRMDDSNGAIPFSIPTNASKACCVWLPLFQTGTT